MIKFQDSMIRNVLVALFGLEIVLGLVACTPTHYASGVRDSAGREQGLWKVHKASNGIVVGSANFVDGKLHGQVELFDAFYSDRPNVKVAQLSFHNGMLHGEYRLYYSGVSFAYAQGRLKTIGHALNNRFTGDFERYLPTGELQVRYKAKNEVVTKLFYGTWEDAQDQVVSDKKLIEEIYLPALLRFVRRHK